MRAVLLGVLALASPAAADVDQARDDIVDIRRGRMPDRSAALGWTRDGAFVHRRTDCHVEDLSDTPRCEVELLVAGPRGTERHPVFAATWSADCVEHPERKDPGCWAIPTEDASRFLARERALLASLGPLAPGTRTKTALAGGTLVGVRYEDAASDRRRAALALVRDGRWQPLRVLWSVPGSRDEYLRSDPAIAWVEWSPDGAWLAVVSHLAHADTDFYFATHRVDVLAREVLTPDPGTPLGRTIR